MSVASCQFPVPSSPSSNAIRELNRDKSRSSRFGQGLLRFTVRADPGSTDPGSRKRQCPSAAAITLSALAVARGIVVAMVPATITAMRSLMPRISGSSDEIMMIAMPAFGELAASAGGSPPSSRRRRPASARRGSESTARSPASARAPPSAGCLPTASRPPRRPTAVLMRRSLHVRSAACAFRAAVDQSTARHAPADSRGSCSRPPTSRARRRAAAGPRERSRSPGGSHRRASRIGTGRAAQQDLAFFGRASGRRSSRPAACVRIRPVRRGRESRRARTDRDDAAHAGARARQIRDRPARCRRSAPRVSETRRRQLAADHHADQLGARHVAAIARVATVCAVAQHRDAVGDRGDLLEPVRDVNDADAFAAQRAR